jgi:hypothetical protein
MTASNKETILRFLEMKEQTLAIAELKLSCKTAQWMKMPRNLILRTTPCFTISHGKRKSFNPGPSIIDANTPGSPNPSLRDGSLISHSDN